MNEYNYNNSFSSSSSVTSSKGLAKVFGFMFLGLLVTAGISYGVLFLLSKGIVTPENYLTSLIISSIAIIVMSFVVHFNALRDNKTAAIVCYFIYTVLWGILLSILMIAYEIITLGLAFLCTSGTFGVMALYAYFTKRETYTLGMFGTGLLFGVITLSLVNIFLQSDTLAWVITYASLFAMYLITIYDVKRAKFMADTGNMTTGLAIYFALNLYVDFIYIFIRLVAIIGNSRR